MDSNKKNIIKSTDKIFNVLETLTRNGKLTISNISKLTGYTKSTTQRIVNSLKELKYVIQDPITLEYQASLKLNELGNRVIEKYAIIDVATPHLKKLSNDMNETVSLGLLKDGHVIYVYDVISKSPLRSNFDIGTMLPIHCSAKGKCIAAYNDSINIHILKFDKYTENTIINKENFITELKKVKNQGYAIDNEEFVNGLVCVAVPILNNDGKAIAAIAITIYAMRVDEINYEEFIENLTITASKISVDLGV